MAIKSRLLNKTVVIERNSTTIDASGDTSGSRSTIEAALKMRITNNESRGLADEQAGPIVTSTHKGFTNGGHGGQKGDFVIDGSDEYTIEYIDKSPGGVISGEKLYHWEIYMNLSGAGKA